MVYFVQPIDGGPIKIGATIKRDVWKRIKQLEGQLGVKLKLLRAIPGDYSDERRIHGQFAHLRFGTLEQFRPAADLLEFIGHFALADEDPNDVEAVSAPMKQIACRAPQEFRDRIRRAAMWHETSQDAMMREAIEVRLIEMEEDIPEDWPPGWAHRSEIRLAPETEALDGEV